MLKYLKEIRINLLQWQARKVLAKYKPTIVALTGSVGKTSTKDAIYDGLKDSLDVRKNIKSYNGELGTPLTILGAEVEHNSLGDWIKAFGCGFSLIWSAHAYPKYLVLEVGLGRPNELRKIAGWLKPDVVVITALSKVPVHVEYFPTVEALIEEKSSLAKAVKPSGVLILNADDEQVRNFALLTPARKLFYGESASADYRAENIRTTYAKNSQSGKEIPVGTAFTVTASGTRSGSSAQSFEIEFKESLGRQHIYPALSALAVANALNVPIEAAVNGLQKHTATPGRMHIIEGINDSTIIDDSYNSSPVALAESLKTLNDVRASGKKIAILGDMRELGQFAEQEHLKAGTHAARVGGLEFLIGVGPFSKTLISSAIEAGFPKEKTAHFLDSREAAEFIKPQIAAGDIILLKGSQNTIRLERAVKILMKHPEQANELLIRQGEFWDKR